MFCPSRSLLSHSAWGSLSAALSLLPESRGGAPGRPEGFPGFSVAPADRPPRLPCFGFPGEAVYPHGPGVPPPSGALFGGDFLTGYGRPVGGDSPRHETLPPRGFGRSPPGRGRLPQPGLQHRGEAQRARNQREKDPRRPGERTGCHRGESGELRAGSESPPAGEDGEEEPLICSRSPGEGEPEPRGWSKVTETCNKSSERRKKRCPHTKLQIRELEKEFLSNVYINKDRRTQLSSLLQLTDRQQT